MDTWLIITAISTGIAAVFSGFSILIAAIAIQQSFKIHKQQMLLSQRQLLLPLWDYIEGLNDINPNNPVWVDVVKAVNTLELIAISWEGQLIDENIIRRMYKRQFMEFYEKIRECKNPPENIEKDGRQMLLDCPAIGTLYRQLTDEYLNHDKLKPIH